MKPMTRPALWFALIFIASIGLFSVILQFEAVERHFVVPFTGVIARGSSFILNLLGMDTQVAGTVISGDEGFSVNILNGCNGVYVMAILISAVLAFPSSWKEKGIGLAIGMAGVQVINLVRIVSLYIIGLKQPALFDQFHYYVWQTGVIILSMAIWIYWAEVLVSTPASTSARAGQGG